jgi:hypothetical protein
MRAFQRIWVNLANGGADRSGRRRRSAASPWRSGGQPLPRRSARLLAFRCAISPCRSPDPFPLASLGRRQRIVAC